MFGMNKNAGWPSAPADAPVTDGKTTVRILRTLPVEGVIYKADELVSFPNKALEGLPPSSFDTSPECIALRKSEGAIVIEHGVKSAPQAESTTNTDEGEIVN